VWRAINSASTNNNGQLGQIASNADINETVTPIVPLEEKLKTADGIGLTPN